MRIIGSDAIDIGQPVNWDNPLTSNLYLMWHALPGMGKQANQANNQIVTWGNECVTGARIRVPSLGFSRGDIKQTQYGARYWMGNTTNASLEVSMPEWPTIISQRSVDAFGFISAAVLFTADGVGAYKGLIESTGSSLLFRLLAGGATGNPLTAQWSADAAEYDAATGLTIPTSGEICLGATSITANGIDVFLITPQSAQSYTISKTLTPQSFNRNWALGFDTVGFGRNWNGTVGPFWVWKNRPITLADCISLHADPWQTFNVLNGTRVFSVPAGATDLTVQDATLPVAFESPALTQVHELAAQDAELPTSFDQVTLTQAHQLTAADATLPTTFDSPALTQLHELAVEDASLPTSFENVTLTQGQALVVQDATLPVAFDSPALGQVHSLTVADSALPVTFDSPGLTQAHQLAADDATIAVLFESPTLFQAHSLAADDATLPTLFDAVTLTSTTVVIYAEEFSILYGQSSSVLIGAGEVRISG